MTEANQTCELEEALRLDALERQQITDTPRDEAFDRLVRMACTALGTPMGAISFIESERLWIKAEQGLGIHETPREISFCTHALTGDDVMVVQDAAGDPRFAGNPSVTSKDGIRLYAGAPLTTKEGYRLGTLSVSDHIPRQVTRGDCDRLQDMAKMVISELEQRRQIGTDSLTGLYTRRFTDELGMREMIRARREGAPLTAAIIGAVTFKNINHTHGEPAGDAVLRAVGSACQRDLRTSDILGRHGGEDLILLLSNTSLKQAIPILERLRQDVAALAIPELTGEQLTASVGAAELDENDLTITGLLRRADTALYRAKQSGCNRVERALAA